MTREILKWVALVAIVAGVLYAIVWGYETWRDGKVAEGYAAGSAHVQALWNKDKLERAAASAKAVADARKEEQDKAALAAKGERDAYDRAAAKAATDLAAAHRAAAAAGGLSGHIAALDRAARALDLPSAAACPAQFVEQRDAALRARELLGACSARYRELGQGTDDAFRGATLKLDTALSYIRVVAPH